MRAESVFTVRHVTRDEAERMSGNVEGGMRWLIVDAHNPEGVHHAQSMLGLPSGADYLIGAIKYARTVARGRRLVLTPEMAAFEAAKDGLELAVRRVTPLSRPYIDPGENWRRAMTKRRRQFQYRVTDVGGDMEGRIAVGDLTLDWWHGKSHTYCVYDLKRGEETGWYSVRCEGECTEEQYARLEAAA